MPGTEFPFSTPKLALLAVGVTAGALGAAWCGLLAWPCLPRSLTVALAAWLGTLSAAAAWAEFASLPALLLQLLPAAWFLLMLVVRPQAQRMARALVLSTGVVALLALLQWMRLDPFPWLGWTAPPGLGSRMRVFATLGNPNFVAAFVLGVLPLAAALPKVSRRHQWWWTLQVVVLAGSLLAAGSRAAVLALGAMLAWLLTQRRLARWWRPVAAATLLAVLLLALGSARPLDTTLAGRLYIWRVVAPHLAAAPLLGYGPGAFLPKYAQWESAWWASGQGTPREREFGGMQDHAHNDFLETLVETGPVGLVSLLAVVVSFLAFAIRPAHPCLCTLRQGAAGGVLALLAVALVDFPLHRPAELFLFWTLMGLAVLSATSSSIENGKGGGT